MTMVRSSYLFEKLEIGLRYVEIQRWIWIIGICRTRGYKDGKSLTIFDCAFNASIITPRLIRNDDPQLLWAGPDASFGDNGPVKKTVNL